MSNIQGVFEIHITVDPADTYALRLFCLHRKYKFILAIMPRGEHDTQSDISSFIQPMSSHYTPGGEKDVVAEGIRIAYEMAKFRIEGVAPIKVRRIKIEALARNPGVDLVPKNSGRYYEFHIKILNITTTEQLATLAEHCKAFAEQSGVMPHVSFACKTEFCPLLTIRIGQSAEGERSAFGVRDALESYLKSRGVEVGSIHSEFCVLDTCPEMDDPWIKR